MNSKKLSIIIPVYNVEKYLDDCLKSIIKQYIEEIEIILIDDGSTDKSGYICDKYSKDYEYIHVIHKENGGLSSARNVGIKEARGEYIWFVDSDDYIANNAIVKIMDKISDEVDLVIGSYCAIYNDGKLVYDYLLEPTYDINPYEYFYNIGSASYAAVRFICRRKFILDNNIFFTEGIYHEDEDWTPRVLCNANNFNIIPGTIYNYRVGNPNSIISTANIKKIYDKLFIAKKMYNKILNDKLVGSKKDFLEYRIEHNYIAALNEVILYKGNDRKKAKQELKDNYYIIRNFKSRKSKFIRILLNVVGIVSTSYILRKRNYLKSK